MLGPARARRGSVEAEFGRTARRFAAALRGVGLVLISVVGVLATPEEALPLGFALLGLAVVGAAVDFVVGARGRGAPLALAFAVVRVLAICVTQEWTGAHTSQWAVHALTITAITLQWEWSPTVTLPVTGLLLTTELVVAGGGGLLIPRLLIECGLSRLAFELLRRSSRRVDDLRARQTALARAEAVSLARHRREREYLALLHDTAASTFLLVAVQGQDIDPGRVARYARHDLDVLTGAAGGPTTQDSQVDLTASLRAVVERSGLTVDVRARDRPLVPASAALALVRAVRETLANVERHAGVRTATLVVHVVDGRVVVTVDDDGAGFLPAAVPTSRRGIRASIVERMAAAGGSATVTSRPGAGTSVRLEWPGG